MWVKYMQNIKTATFLTLVKKEWITEDIPSETKEGLVSGATNTNQERSQQLANIPLSYPVVFFSDDTPT